MPNQSSLQSIDLFSSISFLHRHASRGLIFLFLCELIHLGPNNLLVFQFMHAQFPISMPLDNPFSPNTSVELPRLVKFVFLPFRKFLPYPLPEYRYLNPRLPNLGFYPFPLNTSTKQMIHVAVYSCRDNKILLLPIKSHLAPYIYRANTSWLNCHSRVRASDFQPTSKTIRSK